MKRAKLILIFLIFFSLSRAQNSHQPFEIGPTLFSVNSFRTHTFSPGLTPQFEFLNGFFFRYTEKRWASRGFFSYSQYQTYPFGTVIFLQAKENVIADLKYNDLKIGLGGQYSIYKSSDCLYTFIDLAYNKIIYSGKVYGDAPDYENSITTKADALVSYAGVGAKFGLLPYLFLSPELSYCLTYGISDNQMTNLNTGKTFNYHSNGSYGHPVVKVQLTYRF
jgi:hypothetical protein